MNAYKKIKYKTGKIFLGINLAKNVGKVLTDYFESDQAIMTKGYRSNFTFGSLRASSIVHMYARERLTETQIRTVTHHKSDALFQTYIAKGTFLIQHIIMNYEEQDILTMRRIFSVQSKIKELMICGSAK